MYENLTYPMHERVLRVYRIFFIDDDTDNGVNMSLNRCCDTSEAAKNTLNFMPATMTETQPSLGVKFFYCWHYLEYLLV